MTREGAQDQAIETWNPATRENGANRAGRDPFGWGMPTSITRVAALLVVVSTPALAQDAARATELEEAAEIVIVATRHAAPSHDVPVAVTRVGGEAFDSGHLRRTVPDALLQVPSVMVQRTGHGQASPFIRGFTGFRNVMLVDGIRLNNSVFRSGPNQYWSTVDPFAVGSLEVARGPASVLYGSDAIGGAVNAVGRRHTTFDPGSHVAGRTFVRWADAERSWVVRSEVSGNVDDLGFLVGGTYRSYGDLVAGGGTRLQPDTGYNDTDGDVRLDWRESERATWTFAAQHVDQDAVPRTHKTVRAVPFEGTTVGSELRRDLFQTRDLVYVRTERDDVGGRWADHVEATLSWQRQRERRHRDRDRGRTDIQGFEVRTLGVQVQAKRELDHGLLVYGVEAWTDSVDSFRRDFTAGALSLERVQGPVADDADYDLLGVYLQDEIPWEDGSVIAGARWTYAKADAGRVDNPLVGGSDPATAGNVISFDDSWTDVVFSLRGIRPLDDTWNAYGGASQAFRAPNLSDLTRLDATSAVETPSLGLDPEEFLTIEAGVKGAGEGWTLAASVWRTEIDGSIVQSPTGRSIGGTPEVRKDNVGDGWVSGVEVEGRVALSSQWSLSGGASWMDGEVEQLTAAGREVDRPLSRLMPLTGFATLTYSGSRDVEAWVSGRAADRADQLSLRDETDTDRIPARGTPRYAVVSVGAAFRFGPDVTLSIALENLRNTNYRIHGSGLNEPGRNLVLAVDMRF